MEPTIASSTASRKERAPLERKTQSTLRQSPEFLEPRALLTELTGDTISEATMQEIRRKKLIDLSPGLKKYMDDSKRWDDPMTRVYVVVLAEHSMKTKPSQSSYEAVRTLIYYALKKVPKNDARAVVLALALRLLAENPNVTRVSMIKQIRTYAEKMLSEHTNEVLHVHASRTVEAANRKVPPVEAANRKVPPEDVELDEFEKRVAAFEKWELSRGPFSN